MTKNSDILDNFELILKENARNQLPMLYSGYRNEVPGNSNSKLSLSVDQVICDVSRQIKAIKRADCCKNGRAAKANISKYKKSTFVPVNMLDGAEFMPQNTNSNKFETQCVTDTQLVNIVQDAEELVSQRGIMQEFDTSFCTQEVRKSPLQIVTDNNDLNNIEFEESKENNLLNDKEPKFPIVDISLKEPDRTHDIDCLFDGKDGNNTKQVLEVENEALTDRLESTTIVDKNKNQNDSDNVDLPSSPIFNVKTRKKSTTFQALVVELEAFERFEKIALPIVEKDIAQETVKCLINSKIKINPFLNEDEQQVSHMIDCSESKFEFDQIDENLPTKDKSGSQSMSTQSSILKDEILFSSDEENGCGLQEYYVEDLPFTCALATSFYEHPSVLDKTMYVGFQTASNKSIQISKESFFKARSILDDDESEKPSLRELVEICDGQNSAKIEDSAMVDGNFIVTNGMETVVRDTNTEFIDCKDDITTHKHQSLNRLPTLKDLSEGALQISRTFGFKTASNKKICLSEKALQQSKIIFKDIDFNQNSNSEVINVKENTDIHFAYKRSENENPVMQSETVKDKKEINFDESILLEFANNVMSYENVNKYKTADLIGFKTASNKNIRISDAALEKSKILFKDIESPYDDNYTRDTNTDFMKCFKQSYVGFKTATTACNNETKISEPAVEKPKTLILDEDKDIFECTEIQLSNNEVWDQPSTSKTPYFGFKTASNKQIEISDVAIAKTKKIFEDISSNDEISDVAIAKTKKIFEDISSNDVLNEYNPSFVIPKSEYTNKVTKKRSFVDIEDEADDNKNTLKTNNFVGFRTANNKRIKISEEALIKSRNIFDDLNNEEIGKDSANKLLDDIEKNTNNIQFQGFQTASRKPVLISKDAIKKSKAIFEKLEDIIDDEKFSSKSSKSIVSVKAFHTASNKPINITEQDLLNNNNKLFKNIYENFDIVKTKDYNSLKGFKTTSDKFVKISEDALPQSKKVFENIANVKEEKPFRDFQTATNKEFEIFEDALARDQKTFVNIDIDTKNIMMENNTYFKGFETASNKKVNISAQALARSSKIFENVDVETATIEKVEKDAFQGFQTASNKKVIISETALARSKKIFENIDIETAPIEKVKTAEFQSFQTASNKKVNISETALARSKKRFENISTDTDVDQADVPINNAFQVFLTENHEKVNISKQDLTINRKFIENIDNEKLVFEAPAFRGFKTASNKEVQKSKEALDKSKGIFQDIDISVSADNSTDLPISQVMPIKSANIATRNGSKDYFRETESKCDYVCERLNKQMNRQITNEKFTKKNSANIAKDTVNIENVIDTQVLKDFDKSLNTEDFSSAVTPAKSKRSGSPILSCPKPKRRKKFETPYNKTQKNIVAKPNIEQTNRYDDIKQQTHNFDKNYKKTKKYSLNDICNMEKDNSDTRNSVNPYICQLNFANLLHFEFYGTRNDLSNEKWTADDLKKYFLKFVNKNLVPDGWIDNHLKLIIWKLLSYEIKFPKALGVVCTSKNIIEQLKYRYDKELFNSERPTLRKIMEKDDVSTKLMVLCVADVYEDESDRDKVANQKPVELLLTDGWYCVRACLDRMLSKLVVDGKIAVGSKIVTSGAELVGCDQGIAPWEDTSKVRLKLSGNSTRRARWLTRLGYHGNGAILSRLRDVTTDGGRVARLRVFVARVYPTLYIEKFDDGSTVTRTERLELLHQMKYENERQGLLEKIYEEVQKEFSDEESQDSEVDPELKRGWLDSGSQIARAMKKSRDPAEFRSNLTETQVELLNDHTTRKRDRLIQDVQARVEERIAESGLNVRRNVVPLMKIRIADVREGENVEVTGGLMSIWKPNDAIAEIVKESAWIEVMNVIPTAIRYSEIQISAGRQSIFSQSKKKSEKVEAYTKSMKRICYPIKDLSKNPSMATEYNEIDTVGLIFLIEPSIEEFDSNRSQFQNVYLADADKNIVCVNFWGGLKKLGYENILDTGQVVACMNLQKRAGNTRKNIPQYRVTEFSYFTKTPKNDNARNISEDLDKKLQGVNRMKFCDDCVSLKHNYSVFKMQNYNENVSPYRWQNINLNISKNKMFIDSPLTEKGVKNDENLNLSGLDFESTFKQVDTQQYSPKTMLRKRQVKEKINKLKMYGEPPPLSPIQILNKSRNAGSAFKSPLPKSDVSKSVANANETLLKEKNVESCDKPGSPVIMYRTCFKRTNVNPVKLDFNSDANAIDDSNVNVSVDHFAEEFDGSPPLSLD